MRTIIALCFTFLSFGIAAQVDSSASLLDLLGPEEPTTDYATASFKTNRVINMHSLENTAGGVLDFKISHRFGYLSGGAYELFGLDQAYMRIGFDYGINNRLQVGVGRGNYEKTYDGYVKYKLLRQSKGAKVMPVTVAYLATMSVKTLNWTNPDRKNYFTSRLDYTHQLIIGRKFNDIFTLQVTPTLIHRNLVATIDDPNDVFAVGTAGRVRLSRRIAVNAEYIYVFPGQLDPAYRNSVSLGFDIETGGHVFQLHFTNSTGMADKSFMTETLGDVSKGNIHFGFNVSRVFTLTQSGRDE